MVLKKRGRQRKREEGKTIDHKDKNLLLITEERKKTYRERDTEVVDKKMHLNISQGPMSIAQNSHYAL